MTELLEHTESLTNEPATIEKVAIVVSKARSRASIRP
jgi:hypothetical protein